VITAQVFLAGLTAQADLNVMRTTAELGFKGEKGWSFDGRHTLT
jgi:hypothetical protein